MSALDHYHESVLKALVKDGWTITNNPLQLTLGKRTLSVDVGAERVLIGAERDTQRIAVEIKPLAAPRPLLTCNRLLGSSSCTKVFCYRWNRIESCILLFPKQYAIPF